MNFNRRQNRIAGPGFHINVRYDDQTMALASSNAGSTAPELAMGKNRIENFDVKEQEILVAMKDSTMYHDGYTHCISAANGFPLQPQELEKAGDTAELVLSKVRFVGVATTEYKPSRAYSEQGFVAQVGGVATLINESDETIKPGQSLSLHLNLKVGRRTARDKGIPRDKIRFCLRPTKVGDSLIEEALAQSGAGTFNGKASTKALKTADDAIKKARTTYKTAVEAKDEQKIKAASVALNKAVAERRALDICKDGCDGLVGFLRAYQDLNERVIGKAASYARPGDRLEVILQPRNPY